MQCMPRSNFDVKHWWGVDDTKLKRPVGGAPISAGQQKLSNLRGIKLALYCGEKQAFPAEGPLLEHSGASLLECLQKGVTQNARLRAKKPWKLFFPEEVVAVAMFSDLEERQCQLYRNDPTTDETLQSTICDLGASETPGLDHYLSDYAKRSHLGVYRGFQTGAGFADGTPHEIVLRPEDILEAAGLLHSWKNSYTDDDLEDQDELSREAAPTEPSPSMSTEPSPSMSTEPSPSMSKEPSPSVSDVKAGQLEEPFDEVMEDVENDPVEEEDETV